MSNQPANTQIIELKLHDQIGRFVASYSIREIDLGNGVYEIPIDNLSNDAYYLSIGLNNGFRDAVVIVVRN